MGAVKPLRRSDTEPTVLPRSVMGIACPLAIVFFLFLPIGVLALHNVNRRPMRQFTIRGMLLFIFLWAVCLSQIPVLALDSPGGTISWRQGGTELFAWIVLGIFYGATRQFAALLLHSAGVLFFLCYFAVVFALGGEESWRNIQWSLWIGIVVGSFIGLSFFSLMMLMTVLRRPSALPHEENRPL
jgi:hypothetical protein